MTQFDKLREANDWDTLCSEYNIHVKVRLHFKKAHKIYGMRSEYDPPDYVPNHDWRKPKRDELVDRVHLLIKKLNTKFYGLKSDHRLNMIFTMPLEFAENERPYTIGYIGFPKNIRGFDDTYPTKINPYHPDYLRGDQYTPEYLWNPIDLQFKGNGLQKFGFLLESLWQGKKRDRRKTGRYINDWPYGGIATDSFRTDPFPMKDSPEIIYWSLGLQPECPSYINNTNVRLDQFF